MVACIISNQPTNQHFSAEFLVRAVPVDGGPHTVTLSYEPLSVQVGVLVTGLTWLIVLGIAIVPLSRGKYIGPDVSGVVDVTGRTTSPKSGTNR
jgi:hypothetical protein